MHLIAVALYEHTSHGLLSHAAAIIPTLYLHPSPPPFIRSTSASKFAAWQVYPLPPTPKHQTPNPNPQTPNPKPQTPTPKHQTPNPQTPTLKPQTANPNPQTSNIKHPPTDYHIPELDAAAAAAADADALRFDTVKHASEHFTPHWREKFVAATCRRRR